jgi:hypothetical protein
MPCTPNSKPSKQPHSHEKPKEFPKYLLAPLIDTFVIEHILPNLPLDPSMMWRLCQINHVWHKLWVFLWMACLKHYEALQCVLPLNYCYARTSKAFFETTLQFEIHCLKFCFLYDTKIWDFNCKVALKHHVFWTFSHRQLVLMCMGIQTHLETFFLVL